MAYSYKGSLSFGLVYVPITLHGQHEHQSLLRTAGHIDLLDNIGGIKALVLGIYDAAGNLTSRGSVSLGISKKDEKTILRFAKTNTVSKPWFKGKNDII